MNQMLEMLEAREAVAAEVRHRLRSAAQAVNESFGEAPPVCLVGCMDTVLNLPALAL
jgi:hypothetical protein